ncbi:related to arylamine N-acetyltransferase [Ramularia collo-cygni]|uniref:Related to arylamine N-acetyltransferase n=1 Tax=Ramularia collo-cygni TaxID=112498 RepID=A0A2D3UNW6_9PEZI|nr:related to arylamine N-acetyltransferase [Ramularia collo-cygni]CZT15318.1 related to arylamine N-acetyltransferase [Ramularia collo-cygni]
MSTSILTPSHLSSFLDYISLPPHLHTYHYSPSHDPTQALHFLTQLHIHTISTIPYENLSLHYNPSHTNSIEPLDVFHKIISNARGRGGYCMELSILYNHILRALGFSAYTSMVRIRYRTDGIPAGDYIGCAHIVNIVTLSNGSKYHVDVAFGGDGATAPMPLMQDLPQKNLGNQEIRLHRDHIPSQTLRTEETKLWIYQYRNSSSQPWNSFYAFAEQEALIADFRILNSWTSGPTSFQSELMLVVKFLRREREDGVGQEVYGKRMLSGNVVKENLGGKTGVLEVLLSERQRVEALETWFGIVLTEEERMGIRGW